MVGDGAGCWPLKQDGMVFNKMVVTVSSILRIRVPKASLSFGTEHLLLDQPTIKSVLKAYENHGILLLLGLPAY